MPADAIDRIIDFIAEIDPAFPTRIKGAGPEEVDRLEKAIRRPVEAEYRRFLERMGRSSSWLTWKDARLDIDAVTRFYEYYGNRSPEGHLLIGRGEGEPRYDYYLQSEGEDTHRIVSFEVPYTPERVIRTAGSLPQWIGDKALQVLRRKSMPLERRINGPVGSRAGGLDAFDELMTRLGGPPLWYSNDWMRTYETSDAVVSVFQVPGENEMIATVSAATDDELNRIFPQIQRFVRGKSA